MAQIIEIKIKEKIAKTDFNGVVSFNNVYRLRFDFDEEWEEFPQRVAVVYWEGGAAEVLFHDDECDMPQINSHFSENVHVGVYSVANGKRIASSLVPIRCLPGAYKAPPAKKVDSLYEQIVDYVNKLGDPHKFVTIDTDQTVTGMKTFTENVMVGGEAGGVELNPTLGAIVKYSARTSKPIKLPDKMGTFALLDDIPDINDFKKQSEAAIQPGDVTIAYTPTGERDRETFKLGKGAQIEFSGFDSELIDDDFLCIEGTRLKAEDYTSFQSGDITLIAGKNIGIAQEGNKITFVGPDIPDISGLAEKSEVQAVETLAQKAQEAADSAKSAAKTAQTTADSAKTAAQTAQNAAKASLQPEDVTLIAEQDSGDLNLPFKKGTRILLHGFGADLISDNAISIDGTRLKVSEGSGDPVGGDLSLKGDDTIHISQVGSEFHFSAFLPENHVTTDTEQEITASKTFTSEVKIKDAGSGEMTQISPNTITVGFGNREASNENPVDYLVISPSGLTVNEDLGGESGNSVSLTFPEKSGTIALREDLPENHVTTDTAQEISGAKTFKGNVTFGDFTTRGFGVNAHGIGFSVYVDNVGYPVNFQERSGTIALDEDIPNWARTKSKPDYAWGEIKDKPTDLVTQSYLNTEIAEVNSRIERRYEKPPMGIPEEDLDLELKDKLSKFLTPDDISYIAIKNENHSTSGSFHKGFMLEFHGFDYDFTDDNGKEILAVQGTRITANGAPDGFTSGDITLKSDGTIRISQAAKEITFGAVAPSWDNIEDKPSWIGSSKPSYTWSEIGSKPSWIGSSKPSYTWSEITGKPANLATTNDIPSEMLTFKMNGHSYGYNGTSPLTISYEDYLEIFYDIFFPVGYVYLSFVNESPAKYKPTSEWEAIKGKFLYCNAGTGTGGYDTITIADENMPAHDHMVVFQDDTWSGQENPFGIGFGAQRKGYKITGYESTSNIGGTLITTKSGGGKSLSWKPTYQTVYAWRRKK